MTVITHLWWSRGRCTQRAATRWGTLWTWWWWFDYADADDNDDADDENDDADDDADDENDDMMMMMKSTFSGSLCRWGWRDSRARPPAQPIIIIIIILISKCVADPDKTWLNLLLWWLCRRSWQATRPPNIQPLRPHPHRPPMIHWFSGPPCQVYWDLFIVVTITADIIVVHHHSLQTNKLSFKQNAWKIYRQNIRFHQLHWVISIDIDYQGSPLPNVSLSRLPEFFGRPEKIGHQRYHQLFLYRL